MKKNAMLLLAAALTLTACRVDLGEKKLGFVNETPTEKRLQVSDFERIDIYGSPTVLYTQAPLGDVVIKGPTDQVDNLDVTVAKGRLTLRSHKKLLGDGLDRIVVQLSSPDLIGLTLYGSGDFRCEQPLDTDTLSVELRGSGDVKFGHVVCDALGAELVGSGDLDIQLAEARQADLRLTGSGDLEVKLRNTASTTINLLGSGDVEVDFDNCRHASCSLRGSGDIELGGTLDTIAEQKSGSGDIKKKKLTLKKQ